MRAQWTAVAGIADPGQPRPPIAAAGVFVLRDRDELYRRINRRVETMFEQGVIEEVGAIAATSVTASQMIGLCEIRQLLAGKMSLSQCMAAIQQASTPQLNDQYFGEAPGTPQAPPKGEVKPPAKSPDSAPK